MTIWAGTVDDVPARSNCHPLIHTPPHDYWATCYSAPNQVAYPDILFSSPRGVQTFGELPFVHHASAGPAIGLLSTLPLRGRALFQFNGQVESHEGTSWSDFASGQTTDSELSWSSSSNPVAGNGNIQRSKDLSILRSFCAEATMNTTAAHLFYNSVTGMTSGSIDDAALNLRCNSTALRAA